VQTLLSQIHIWATSGIRIIRSEIRMKNGKYTRCFNHLITIRSILLGFVCFALIGCVGSPKLPGISIIIPPAKVFDEKTSLNAWRTSQVVKYGDIWINESTSEGNSYNAGKAAYYLALATLEPEWSKAAINAFNNALDAKSNSPHRARAGLGAAHRLAARDFPITGAAQYILLGIPGWKRSYHVLSSFSHLNNAVEAAPNDPVIRLLRGAAFVGIPEFFGGHEIGFSDYEKLERWTNSPSSNSDYFVLLSSNEWRDEYYFMRAQTMKQVGDKEEEIKALEVLSNNAVDIYLKLFATYRLADLNRIASEL
jgi:hypothetical protein